MTKLSLVNTHRKGPDSLFVFYSKFLQNTCYSNNYKTLNIPIIQIMKSNEFFPKENSVIFFSSFYYSKFTLERPLYHFV